MKKSSSEQDWKELKKQWYRLDARANFGRMMIDFSPESMKDFAEGSFKSYDEYLYVQRQSVGSARQYFAMCFYDTFGDNVFKGQIERFDSIKEKVVFRRVMVNGLYRDGIGFLGKEDHVWTDSESFSEYGPGDCVRFSAKVYRYLKTGRGKLIDFGLKDVYGVSRIEAYEVPTDQELIDQQIDRLVCETCRFYEHCYLGNCIANEEERKNRFELLKSFQPGKFTPLTVWLAYELEYRMILQTDWPDLGRMGKKDPVMRKFLKICHEHPVYYVGDPAEAFERMLHPDKIRLYIE